MEYTIRDLLDIVEFRDIERILRFIYYYEDDAFLVPEQYHTVFEELKTYGKVKTDEGDSLVIKASDMDGDEKRWYSVSLHKSDGKDYAMEFTDWKELVDISISVSTIEHYTSEDIIAHFLWEITFFGYSREDVENKRKEILSRVDEDGMIKLEINDEESLTKLEIKKEEVK